MENVITVTPEMENIIVKLAQKWKRLFLNRKNINSGSHGSLRKLKPYDLTFPE